MSSHNAHGGVCPACLQQTPRSQRGYECLCGFTVPTLLLQEFDDSSPLALQLLGWSGHGKTSYLTALSFVLSRVSLVWRDFTLRGGTPGAREQITAALRLVHEGAMPEETPASSGIADAKPTARHTYMLRNLPKWGNRVVLAHDPSGQFCNEMALPIDHLPLLVRAPVSLMFFSTDDLEAGDFRTMDLLLTSFMQTLQDGGRDSPRGRGVVVVLSKADLMLTRLPPEIRNYLVSDPLRPILREGAGRFYREEWGTVKGELEDMPLYLENMYRAEADLQEWLGEEPSFRTMQIEARRHGVELRFVLVSATGEEVKGRGPLFGRWRPCRVIDPFLWALKMTEESGGVLPLRSSTYRSWDGPSFDQQSLGHGHFSLMIHDRRRGRSHKVNIEKMSGDLGKVMLGLRDVTFFRESDGIRLRIAPGDASAFFHHKGGIDRVSSSEMKLKPGESLSTEDWQVEVRSGYFGN